jgi:3-hydroxybutyryl-CoA dehydrogenase
MEQIGVVGAGVMGTGVAQNLAESGFSVTVVDTAPGALERFRKGVVEGRRMLRLMRKLGKDEGDAAVLGRIRTSDRLEALADVPLVVENVTESWPVKAELYKRLDELCLESAVFVANTSAIPITRIASATRRPASVIGVHFMNPVPLKHTVEMIRGVHTSDRTTERTRGLLEAMGKTVIEVADAPGFISNRVLMLAINEAVYLVQEKAAAPEEIDRVFRECFGHPMGPLATADLIGLDTILQSIEVLRESFSDCKYRPCPLLKTMVEAGRLGRKSGQGFFSYE